MVTRAPLLPLVIYMTVALVGFFSCGTMTPDIIIEINDPNSELAMTIGKAGKNNILKFNKFRTSSVFACWSDPKNTIK